MDNADSDTITTTKRASRKTPDGLINHSLLPIGMSLLGILLALAFLWWQLVYNGNQSHQQTIAESHQAQMAAYFNGRIASLRAQSKAMAGAAGTVAALRSMDPAVMQAHGAALTEQTEFGKRVEIIPKGRAQVDLNAQIPISFAALDVIKRAEFEEFVGPEGAPSQRGLIYVARSITVDGVVAGVLYMAVSKDYFIDPIATFDADLGAVVVEQSFDNGVPVQLIQWGTSADQSDIDLTPIKLTSPHWSVDFLPNDAQLSTVATSASLLPAFAVAAALSLGGILLGFARLLGRLNQDATTFGEYAAKLVRTGSAKPPMQDLPLFKNLTSLLTKQAPGEASNGATPSKLTQASKTSKTGKVGKSGNKKRVAKAASRDAKPEDNSTDEIDNINSLLMDEDNQPDNDNADEVNEYLEVSRTKSDDNFGIEVSEETDAGPMELGLKLDPNIFRAYDIRGIVKTNLNTDVVYWIGRAFAAEAAEKAQSRVAVGRDGRLTSEDVKDALCRGLNDGGCDVVDIGEVPTPMLYYATHALDTGTGIMITGSHNPPEYNGLKMMLARKTLAESEISNLYERITNNDFSTGSGDVDEVSLDDQYVDRILDDVVVPRPLKVVVDCGNGIAGKIAPRLLEELGCEVVPLYCDVDGNFPNHHPDPAEPKNLEDLMTVVADENADLGLAFDGDGDRLGVVTHKGTIIWPDRLMMLFSQDIIGRNPGADIIFDVKCSRHLNNLISEFGGRPIMWKTGHSHIKAKMKETGALLGGEFSGHICFAERWFGFDDALYSAARLLEILGAETADAETLFTQFPDTVSTPELKINTTEERKFAVIEDLIKKATFEQGAITDIDGLRVDFEDGWGLIRASNTSPVLSLRFEADDDDALNRIQEVFRTQLSAIDSSMTF